MMNIWIIVGIFVVLALFAILLYNSLVTLRNKVKNSFAQVDVQLKRRNDLIPNLVETVKGYMKHEKSVLENVTKARASVAGAKTLDAKAKASNMLSDTLKTLFAVAENYPQLKANENFMKLQDELAGTEDKISYARQTYNDMVMVYNVKIEKFPNNLLAGLFGFKQEHMFETGEEERKAVKVSF